MIATPPTDGHDSPSGRMPPRAPLLRQSVIAHGATVSPRAAQADRIHDRFSAVFPWNSPNSTMPIAPPTTAQSAMLNAGQ